MDPKSVPAKLKDLKGQKKLLMGGLGLIVIVSGLTFYLRSGSPKGDAHSKHAAHGKDSAHGEHGAEHASHDEHGADHKEKSTHTAHASHGTYKKSGSWFTRIWNTYGEAFVSVQSKVDALRRSEEDNEKLRLENAHLRLVLESEHFEKYAEKAEKLTQAFEWKLAKETGARAGRTLASINYKIPTDLVPSQLYTLGVTYFKMRDDEKAAVIFTFLTGMDGDDTYKTPGNQLLTGIAWYRLENFELADFYFDQVIHAPKAPSTRRLSGQAHLWKGLVAERTGKHIKAQFWLHEVMDHDPRSAEAHWVNRQEVEREPAQEHSEKSEE